MPLLLLPLGANNGDVPALFVRGEMLASPVLAALVSMGVGDAPFGSTHAVLGSLVATEEERGRPAGTGETPSTASSGSPFEWAVALDLGRMLQREMER